MKYLKKRKLYSLAASMLSYDGFPICAHCSYRFHGGFEWLTFSTSDRHVTFSVMNCGSWIRVVEKQDDCVVRNEVLKRMECTGSYVYP